MTIIYSNFMTHLVLAVFSNFFGKLSFALDLYFVTPEDKSKKHQIFASFYWYLRIFNGRKMCVKNCHTISIRRLVKVFSALFSLLFFCSILVSNSQQKNGWAWSERKNRERILSSALERQSDTPASLNLGRPWTVLKKGG